MINNLLDIDKIISYPRFQELHKIIEECLKISEEAREPLCMCLEGLSGVGKSTLVQTYASLFPRLETETGSKIPIFYMETPSPVTVKAMAAEMLARLGDPGAQRETLWSMNHRLVNFIRDCEVRLVILDDFHHLIDSETKRILETVSDWLKVLIKNTGVPFLVVGIDGEVQRILKANTQLNRLFIRETLSPFQWDPTQPHTIDEFLGLMTFLEEKFHLHFAKTLISEELFYRIHYATDGLMAHIMRLFYKVASLIEEKQLQSKKVVTLGIPLEVETDTKEEQ